MKTLVTERLILRPLKPSDLEAFHTYSKKPNIGPNAGWKPHQSYEESEAILKMMIREDEVWGITEKNSDVLIGTIGLHVRNFDNALLNQKEIGYVLDDVHWGKGYMTEAVKAVLHYAFVDVELDFVLCGHALLNLRSERVIAKTGFVHTHHEYRDHYDGTKIEIKMYQISKIDYLGGLIQ